MEKKIYSKNLQEDKRYLEPGFPAKFIIIREEIDGATKTQAIFFRPEYDHDKVAEIELGGGDNRVFVGAGVMEDGRAMWGSSTCEEFFGYFMPNDPKAVTDLLKEVQQEFLELLD